jgi:hypothetical protein
VHDYNSIGWWLLVASRASGPSATWRLLAVFSAAKCRYPPAASEHVVLVQMWQAAGLYEEQLYEVHLSAQVI